MHVRGQPASGVAPQSTQSSRPWPSRLVAASAEEGRKTLMREPKPCGWWLGLAWLGLPPESRLAFPSMQVIEPASQPPRSSSWMSQKQQPGRQIQAAGEGGKRGGGDT